MTELHDIRGRKIAVAMSGGVDSTVTAHLLRVAGGEVHGVFMLLGQPGQEAQAERAAALAARLGVELEVVDLQMEFAARVIDYFRASYFGGRTPNPCVVCNREIKLGLLLEKVRAGGAEFLATGHYARLRRDTDGSIHLLRGSDSAKDQSYFLSQVIGKQLCHLLFPLGAKRKTEIYELARGLGLDFSPGQESQDVCFLKGSDPVTFLERDAPPDCGGPVVTGEGLEVGRHRGVHHFTIGQRRGLGIPAAAPYYVVALDARGRRVVVGAESELYRRRFPVSPVHWLGEVPPLPTELLVQIRYRHRPVAARVLAAADGRVEVSLREPQRAVTPGQFAVFYREDEVVGGGEIGLPE